MTATPAALSLRGVRIRHDGAEAWTPDGVTLDVAPGEVLLILGPSGCGKSTLTLALNGLVPHALPATLDGRVLVGGGEGGALDTADARVAELSERVGMVFQDPDAQLVTTTVLDEVCFGPENLLVPVAEVLTRAEAALRAVDLWDRRADDPDTLSGGGKQRLAIACALALDAPILVLDEPTANLDPDGIDEVYAALRAILGREPREPREPRDAAGREPRDAAGREPRDAGREGPGGPGTGRGGVASGTGGSGVAGGSAADGSGTRGSGTDGSGTGRSGVAGGLDAARRSIVLVEHDLDAAIDLVDTVAVLDAQGRLVAHGPVAEVLRSRADELLALGVWLPTATLAALRLRALGVTLTPLPLTAPALTAALDTLPALPTLPHPPTPTPKADEMRQSVASARPKQHFGASRGAASASAASAASAVGVRGLSVARGRRDARREVLRDVSLDVGHGDFVAIVGANGAGKTSLVQAIAGVVRPPRGTVDLGGVDPARASATTLTEAVGFVFQNPEHQFVTNTVVDELAYGLRLRKVPEPEVNERVDRMLATLGLQGHQDAHPFLLSGGQKRRLSVGTALITEPPLLVLDEPTFGQDRERATDLLTLLAALNASGTTVVIVTHDLQVVAEYASHVAILAGGRIAAFGETVDVLSDAATLDATGMRRPPLAQAFAALENHPGWRGVTRLADIRSSAQGPGDTP